MDKREEQNSLFQQLFISTLRHHYMMLSSEYSNVHVLQLEKGLHQHLSLLLAMHQGVGLADGVKGRG